MTDIFEMLFRIFTSVWPGLLLLLVLWFAAVLTARLLLHLLPYLLVTLPGIWLIHAINVQFEARLRRSLRNTSVGDMTRVAKALDQRIAVFERHLEVINTGKSRGEPLDVVRVLVSRIIGRQARSRAVERVRKALWSLEKLYYRIAEKSDDLDRHEAGRLFSLMFNQHTRSSSRAEAA